MGLPQYSGPFAVGAIDLEIPVREPRSFGTEYVSNRVINKPKVRPKSHSPNHIARESHARAKKAAQNRTESGGPDLESDEAAHQHNDRSGSSSSGSNEIDDKQTDWNPFSEGAKTTTLHLSTVLFTLFYPTDESIKGCSDRKVAWMGRPKRKGIIAMLRYLGQYGPLAVPAAPTLLSLLSAKIPAIAGARLADPSSDKATAPPPKEAVEMGNFGNDPPSFPVVIFSHGLAGTRLSYSQFCGELASHGVIVAAIEHRDGSGIASTVRVLHSSSSMANEKRKDEVAKLKVPYFAFEKVGLRSFAEEPTEKEAGLRKAQLAMRSAEIKECLHVLREIQQGKGKSVAKSSTRGLSSKLGVKVARGKEKQAQSQLEADRLQMWEGKLDADFPALCGHSFGGATVIEMQRKGPIVTRQGEEENNDDNSNGDGKKGSNTSPFPFSIVLDPWVEPIEWRKDGEESDPRPMLRPAYVINSETFTIWKDHFGKLKRIMHDSRQAGLDQQGWLMTLCGCQHLDFSDLPFLLPHVFRSTVGPKATISIFSRATYAQMGLIRQRRRDHLSLPGAKSMNSSSPLHNDDSRRQSAIESTRDSAQGKLGSIGGQDDAKIGTKIQTSMESTQFRRGHFGQGQDDTGKPTQLDGETFNEKPQWSTSLHDSPLRRTSQDRERQMSSLKDKKGQAASKLWQGKRERDAAQERRKQQVMSERQRRGLVVTFANRTNSGNILIVDNNEEERIDFSERAADVAADEDASEVHKSLEDISASLDYKRPKIHSLMAFAFRLKGLKPGLAAPGKVLIHEY